LLLGGCPRVVTAVARNLDAHGIKAHTASLIPSFTRVRSRAIASFCYLPTDTQAFVENIKALVEQHAINLIYPCGDEALTLLSQTEEQLRPFVKLACPRSEVVQRILDKSQTMTAAEAVGLPVPKEYHFGGLTDFLSAADSIIFPVIAKPLRKDTNEAAFRIRYYDSAGSLKQEFERDSNFGKGVLIQEFIPGGGVGIEILMSAGQPLLVFQHRRLSELPFTGGVSVRARSEIVDPALKEYAVRLLQYIGWDGVAMVEFRHDTRTGRLALMEVNGRYWGSLPLSFFAGLEFPWYQWQIMNGDIPDLPSTYKLTEMRWLSGDIQRSFQIMLETLKGRFNPLHTLKELIAVPLGFFTSTNDAIWSAKDRTPALDEIRDVFDKIIKPQFASAAGMLLPFLRRRQEMKKQFGSIRASRLFDDLRSGRRPHTLPPEQIQANRILVLCHGNIIRSPFVAAILSSRLQSRDIQVESAGLGCIEGRPADPRAIRLARTYGVNLNRHHAQHPHSEMIEKSDAIFVMDYRNLAMFLDRWPEMKSRIFLMGDFIDGNTDREIPDPYEEDGQAFKDCYADLLGACEKVAEHLVRKKNQGVSVT